MNCRSLFYRKELLCLTVKEQGRAVPPIAAMIKIVYVFFLDIKESCSGLFGFRTVK